MGQKWLIRDRCIGIGCNPRTPTRPYYGTGCGALTGKGMAILPGRLVNDLVGR